MKPLLLSLCAILSLSGSMARVPEAQAVTLKESIKVVVPKDQFPDESKLPKKVLRFKAGKDEAKGKKLSVVGLITKITNGLTFMVAAVAIFMMVLYGFRITVSAGGDELSKAKTGLTWSAAGLGMIIFAYIIVKTVIALTYVAS